MTLNQTFHEATATQNLPHMLLPLFGEFLASAALLSETLKFNGTLTLQARGDGSLPLVMAEATNEGNLRGIIQIKDKNHLLNNDTQQRLPLIELIGNGVFTLTVDAEKGERYQGIVPLDGADIAGCVERYFEQSEQLPTSVVLFADSDRCGGLFLQCLPMRDATDAETRDELWQTTKHLAATLKQDEFFATDHNALLYKLFHELDVISFEPKSLQFKCSCSRERSENALKSLGEKELLKLNREKPIIDIDCQFCGQAYPFDEQDVSRLISTLAKIH